MNWINISLGALALLTAGVLIGHLYGSGNSPINFSISILNKRPGEVEDDDDEEEVRPTPESVLREIEILEDLYRRS